ncbi:GNAT family N-acetyltransferase [Rossellomorea marisflavi]|uniref:GNAT family N-acetyltransferase n=1 Tax=Rossellomorea marisflavi TaxID=189381 RepID=UPI001EE34E17|nr:GNAT family N-acetyltransferase [Rossellomorea marisflavi]UKS65179.1 GNAT family N-acetyltransferase [Rossellomorea marisflavi]
MRIVYSGTLKTSHIPFLVKVVPREGSGELLALQESVRSALQEPAILQPLSAEEFDHILAGNGLILGVYVEGELVGARAVLFPAIDEGHLGNDVGIPRSEWSKVVYQEISFVSENVRGNGLQKLLGQLIMDELKSRTDECKYVCCTVAPYNIPSLKDKFNQGLAIGGLKQKYGGHWRYIFFKDLKEEFEILPPFKEVSMKEFKEQQDLLKAGWRGVSLTEDHGEWKLIFGKKEERITLPF